MQGKLLFARSISVPFARLKKIKKIDLLFFLSLFSAHMSEETQNASTAAPWGVITSVGSSAVFGFFLLCSYLFCIQDFDGTLNSPTGSPVLQIFIDCFGQTGATIAMGIVIICVAHW